MQRKSHVLDKILEQPKREKVVARFLESGRVTELAVCALAGSLGSNPLRDVLLFEEMKMQLKLVPELAIVAPRQACSQTQSTNG